MKHKIGEQWVEEIDGKMHMLKAVQSVDIGACTACDFEGQESKCAGFPNSVCGSNSNSFIIKDLGVLNDDGCLPEERTGKYPVVKKVISLKLMGWVWWAGIEGESDINGAKLSIGVEALTEQEAIDAWNRRD